MRRAVRIRVGCTYVKREYAENVVVVVVIETLIIKWYEICARGWLQYYFKYLLSLFVTSIIYIWEIYLFSLIYYEIFIFNLS